MSLAHSCMAFLFFPHTNTQPNTSMFLILWFCTVLASGIVSFLYLILVINNMESRLFILFFCCVEIYSSTYTGRYDKYFLWHFYDALWLILSVFPFSLQARWGIRKTRMEQNKNNKEKTRQYKTIANLCNMEIRIIYLFVWLVACLFVCIQWE